MTHTNQTSTTASDRRPDCVTEILQGNSVLTVSRVRQLDRNRHRYRRDDASAGFGRCYTQNGYLTDHNEADVTLLPLYRQPPHVVQSMYGILGLAVRIRRIFMLR
jgi:hypothetical protein